MGKPVPYPFDDEERPPPRSAAEIFADLRGLALSNGSLHEITSLIYRDWTVSFDITNVRIVDDPKERWSPRKLAKNELFLLLGLIVQSESDRTYTVSSSDGAFAARADWLLREFHDRVMSDVRSVVDSEIVTVAERPDPVGQIGREAIYYGGETFYVHQLRSMTRQRYSQDADWLLRNVGITIDSMVDVAEFIAARILDQMNSHARELKEGRQFSKIELTNSVTITKSDVLQKFGAKADAFFAKFATPPTGVNAGYTDPFAINQVAIAPIIDLGERLYIPNQYRLFESLYESPFYWMMADKAYMNSVAEHRGKFLEVETAERLRSVFGAEHVYENVTLHMNARDVAGEIDTLVLYGDFCLIVQTKSKRITLKARAGDSEALRADFKGAIHDPYRQALECIDFIKAGAKCFDCRGYELKIPKQPHFFPVVMLSDTFPGSAYLSIALLERGEAVAPVVWDLAMLDCMTRVLPIPILLLDYLKCRTDVFETVLADSEYNYLGYHITERLEMEPGHDFMILVPNCASVVDDYMIATDHDLKPERPLGLLERIELPFISPLFAELRLADARIASVVVDLFSLPPETVRYLSKMIGQFRAEIVTSGEEMKAISIPTKSGGLSYVVVQKRGDQTDAGAQEIGEKYKYQFRADRWCVIVDSLETDHSIDRLYFLAWPWEEDAEAEMAARRTSESLKTQYVSIADRQSGAAASKPNSLNEPRPKVGDFLRSLIAPRKPGDP